MDDISQGAVKVSGSQFINTLKLWSSPSGSRASIAVDAMHRGDVCDENLEPRER